MTPAEQLLRSRVQTLEREIAGSEQSSAEYFGHAVKYRSIAQDKRKEKDELVLILTGFYPAPKV